MDYPDDLTSTERAALVTYWLAQGQTLTTREVADKLGLHYNSAYALLGRLCRVLPIVYDRPAFGVEGCWFMLPSLR